MSNQERPLGGIDGWMKISENKRLNRIVDGIQVLTIEKDGYYYMERVKAVIVNQYTDNRSTFVLNELKGMFLY